ncbi:MAG TPA: PAS domain S-box protein [Methanocella sp.]|nr:PAS domain S-box protein [Methanocella sp.]
MPSQFWKKPDDRQDRSADLREGITRSGEEPSRKKDSSEPLKKLADLEKFKALLDQSNDAIFLTDVPSGLFLYVSRSVCDQIGYHEAECYSLTMYDILPENSGELDRIYSGKSSSILFTARIHKKNTEEIQCELNMRRVRFENKEYVLAISRDSTERIQAEEALRESEERFRALAETSAAAIIVYRQKFMYVNPAAESLTGYSKDELLNMNFWDVMHTEFRETVKKRGLMRLQRGTAPTRYESKVARKDGQELWINISTTIFQYENQPAGLAIAIDITDRKRAEEALRESEEKFRVLAESSTAAIVIIQNGRYVNVNRASEQIMGYSKEELTGKRLEETIHPDFKEQVLDRYFARHRGEDVPSQYEIKIVARSGESRWIQLTAGRIMYRGKPATVATLFDITERKRYEKELRESKQRAELYLDLMGHDITNMNQSLMGYLEIMEIQQEAGASNKDLIENSIEIIRRSSRMISDVKKLTQVQAEKAPLKNVDACEILSVVKSRYSSLPDRQATINYVKGSDCIVRAGDLLSDVFDNLIDNAIRHSTGPVIIDLTYDQVILEGRRYYRIFVTDTGPGIPDNLKKKIFMTVKESGEKTERRGFGLYLITKIIDYYHGRVWVEDRVPGDYTQGARFVVMLPASEG